MRHGPGDAGDISGRLGRAERERFPHRGQRRKAVLMAWQSMVLVWYTIRRYVHRYFGWRERRRDKRLISPGITMPRNDDSQVSRLW